MLEIDSQVVTEVAVAVVRQRAKAGRPVLHAGLVAELLEEGLELYSRRAGLAGGSREEE